MALEQKPANHYAYLLTVDPGLGGTGLAFWDDDPAPYHTAVLKRIPLAPLDMEAWLAQAFSITERFGAMVRAYQPVHVAIEGQAIWDNTATAYAAAKRGDVLKLAVLAGMLAGRAYQNGAVVSFLSPARWKGQLPKRTVIARIKRKLGVTYPDHIADAVGMGLYLRGVL